MSLIWGDFPVKMLARGTAFGRAITSNVGPRVVYVTLAARDFFNPSTFLIRPNSLPSPDSFVPNKPTSSGGVLSNESGYLGGQTTIDIAPQMQSVGMEFVQCVLIDNSLGAGVCIIRDRATGMQVTAAPFTQGVYPLLLPFNQLVSLDIAYIDVQADNLASLPSWGTYPDNSPDISGGGGQFFGYPVESGFLRLQFTDTVMPLHVWKTRNWDTYVWYNFAVTIAAGGVYQTLWNYNPFRKAFLVGNALDSTEPIFLAFHQVGEIDAPNESIGLSPGQWYEQKGPCVYTGSVRVMSPTAGHVIIAKEGQ